MCEDRIQVADLEERRHLVHGQQHAEPGRSQQIEEGEAHGQSSLERHGSRPEPSQRPHRHVHEGQGDESGRPGHAGGAVHPEVAHHPEDSDREGAEGHEVGRACGQRHPEGKGTDDVDRAQDRGADPAEGDQVGHGQHARVIEEPAHAAWVESHDRERGRQARMPKAQIEQGRPARRHGGRESRRGCHDALS